MGVIPCQFFKFITPDCISDSPEKEIKIQGTDQLLKRNYAKQIKSLLSLGFSI